MSDLKSFWNDRVPKGHKHFVGDMQNEKIKRLNDRLHQYLLKSLPLDKISTALDWGCGGGLPATELAKQNISVVLADISQESISEAVKLLNSHGLSNKILSTVEIPNNPSNISLPAVDLILCVQVIHHMPSLDYFKKVVQLWKMNKPEFIAIDFKLEGKTKRTSSYEENYTQALILSKKDVTDAFNSEYKLHKWSVGETVAFKQKLGFAIFKLI